MSVSGSITLNLKVNSFDCGDDSDIDRLLCNAGDIVCCESDVTLCNFKWLIPLIISSFVWDEHVSLMFPNRNCVCGTCWTGLLISVLWLFSLSGLQILQQSLHKMIINIIDTIKNHNE